jgi:hypothetical protein
MSRLKALMYRHQFDMSDAAQKAGITMPTFVSRGVYSRFLGSPDKALDGDASEILAKLMDELGAVILKRAKVSSYPVRIPFRFQIKSRKGQKLTFGLLALFGPTDFDDSRQSITIVMPGEE